MGKRRKRAKSVPVWVLALAAILVTALVIFGLIMYVSPLFGEASDGAIAAAIVLTVLGALAIGTTWALFQRHLESKEKN